MAVGGSKRRGQDRSSKAGRSVAGKSTKSGPLHFEISSNYHASREVQDAILDKLVRRGFNSHSTFAVKLALEEAMINAIKHGNKLDKHKQVTVDVTLTADTATIVIEDQGPGFDRGTVSDPTLEDNLEKCSGRGILLMEAYMNQVTWSRAGRRVTMVKRNDPDTLPRR